MRSWHKFGIRDLLRCLMEIYAVSGLISDSDNRAVVFRDEPQCWLVWAKPDRFYELAAWLFESSYLPGCLWCLESFES